MNAIKNIGLSAILSATAIAQTPVYNSNTQTYTYQAKDFNTKISNNLDKIATELAKGMSGEYNVSITNHKKYLKRMQDGLNENGEATEYRISYKTNTFATYNGGQGLSHVKFTSSEPLKNIVKILEQ